MDIAQVLYHLGFNDNNGEQPASDLSTYNSMVATWRHPTKQPPTEADMLAAWVIIELGKAIANKKEAVNALYLQKATAPFTHGDKIFDATKEAQDNIHKTISRGQLGSISDATSRTWVLANNVTVSLTWGELRAMAQAMFDRADALHGYARIHKDTIGGMTEIGNVNAYNITENWGT